jgi:pimeloyl-ACP methyl ester carboxylesterase
MQALCDRYPGPAPAECLLVLLPPAEARPEDFHAQGFVDAVRQRGIATDILLAEVNYQHVMARSVAAELNRQVLQAAGAGRYRQIWVAGISLGAFNALHFAAVHGQALAGLFLMSPYPGTRDILREISAAGGPLPWADSPDCSDADERLWWRWLARQAQAGRWELQLYLSTGTQDRFLPGQRLLAGLLPAPHIRLTEGGHDWLAWKPMWEHWLDHGPLAGTGPGSNSDSDSGANPDPRSGSSLNARREAAP